MKRKDFAARIGAGLAGWFQQMAAQDLEHQVSEDAARVQLVQTISAQRAYIPETSQRPTNWPSSTKKRVDVAVLGKREGATGWYGAIELKWPRESRDFGALRRSIVEDAVRVAFATTANLCANFVIVGGTTAALESLFDTPHPQAQDKEDQRKKFCELFQRKPAKPEGRLTNADLNDHFPDPGDRVPQTVFNGWTRRLMTELIIAADAKVGNTVRGSVYIWQCKK